MADRKLGFHVARTITIEGPFQMHPRMDVHWAHATVETQGTTHRVVVMISGQSELAFMGSGAEGRPTEGEREEARALFALAELAWRRVQDFERSDPRLLPEIRVSVGPGPDSVGRFRQMWTIASVRKHEALRGFTVSPTGPPWRAEAKG